jgi:hypothetical protein
VSERIKFTVWRDRWLRGAGDGLLLDSNGHRCCLGFLGQQLGCSDDEQRSVGLPQELPSADKWPATLVLKRHGFGYTDAGPIDTIVSINDAVDDSDEEREAELTELFAAKGIDVEFRDGSGE